MATVLPPLGTLGWQGIGHDDADVAALRETLRARAGIPGIGALEPCCQVFYRSV